jgi:hypothetical protein
MSRVFSQPLLAVLDRAKILGIRSGPNHAYVGVWVVVVNRRVFVRSWNDKPGGWFRAFLAEPAGSLQLPTGDVPILGRPLRDVRLRDAVTAAYAGKYPTKGSAAWVAGFAESQRLRTTLELLPREPMPS